MDASEYKSSTSLISHPYKWDWLLALRIMGIALLVAICFWLVDSFLLYTYGRSQLEEFKSPETFWEALSPNAAPRARYVRMTFLVGSLLAGGLVTCYFQQKRQIVHELWESEQRYRALFDHTPIAIGITSLDGRVLDYNAALLTLGYDEKDKARINVVDVYANSADRQRMLAELQEKGIVQNFETRFRRKDGTLFDASLTVTPVEQNGQTMLMTVIQDITSLLNTQERLVLQRAELARQVEERTAELLAANAALEEASQLKDEFLANMNHELRTPLTVILTLTGMLQQELYGPLQTRQQQALRNIEESGQRLLNLITDVWDLSKLEAGELLLQHLPFSITSVCEVSLAFIHHHAQRKNIVVVSDIDTNVEMMFGDEKRVKQMLTNLLDNAVKFTLEGGQVGLEVRGDTERNLLSFVVWDTGIGIAPEKIGRLFQPFTQVDGSSTREHEGSGLGLALVDRLARLYHGMVSVQSEEGKGSRFTLILPWER